MTEAQAAWLRKLRDQGPQYIGNVNEKTLRCCDRNGWTTFGPILCRKSTPAGLAALAAHEEKGK